jgi:hypothetical protein
LLRVSIERNSEAKQRPLFQKTREDSIHAISSTTDLTDITQRAGTPEKHYEGLAA